MSHRCDFLVLHPPSDCVVECGLGASRFLRSRFVEPRALCESHFSQTIEWNAMRNEREEKVNVVMMTEAEYLVWRVLHD